MTIMPDPYPLFSVFSFLGFIAVIIPLPWHLEAWNSGTCFFMMWAALGCLNAFVNSVVWHGNVINHAPVWCDISTRIMMGVSVGIPAASFCINRRLYNISHMQAVSISRSDKRRAVLIDTAFCVLLPLITLVLGYIVQGHRFNLVEDIGCYPAIFNSVPTFFLVYMWPLLLGVVSFVYAGLTLRAFMQRRAQLSEFLTSNTSLTASRYLRLMALATTEMLCTTPLAIFVIYLNATTEPVNPWKGFADTHFGFSAVDQIPAAIWHTSHELEVSLELSRWLNPACAFTFFAFFGFAAEARRHYREAFWAVAKRLGIRPSECSKSNFSSFGPKSSFSSHGTLPVYMPPLPPRFMTSASSLNTSFGDLVHDKMHDKAPSYRPPVSVSIPMPSPTATSFSHSVYTPPSSASLEGHKSHLDV